ncbi:protein translocase subunit SecF [Salinispora cortesiana]|uniref:protein translocase subunit SecF n=1 Tax=Salinispora cortesiana TaxID=1305843 RepID=UPI000426B5F8|nr:protein translocase subunit SecF [Salinispora cortesiana]
MAGAGLASRLYRGEAGLDIVGRRKVWFGLAGVLALISVLSFAFLRFDLGIEFAGGSSIQVPASVGTLEQAEEAVDAALATEGGGAEVVTAQKVGGTGDDFYEMRTSQLSTEQSNAVKAAVAEEFGLPVSDVSGSQVSQAWGSQVTERAVLGLVIFLVLVMVYLVLRFEWRMAVGAVSSLLMNLVLTAGIYSLVGFEVTPSTVIGFLTILGFALYDVVVVFDKIQENTRGITANSNQTYGEAANLAINQSLMRSLNTSIVALLPVGGLLFIGAGLFGAGTLKDLGLVLFVGMAVAFFSSITLATPLLVLLKNQEPRIQAHNKRVLARRAALERGEGSAKSAPRPTESAEERNDPEAPALAGAAPKVGARPAGKRPTGARGGRPAGGGNRPGGKRR